MFAERDVEKLVGWVGQESPTLEAAAVNAMADMVVSDVDPALVGLERIAGRDGLGDILVLRAGPQTGRQPGLVIGHRRADGLRPGRDLDLREAPMTGAPPTAISRPRWA